MREQALRVLGFIYLAGGLFYGVPAVLALAGPSAFDTFYMTRAAVAAWSSIAGLGMVLRRNAGWWLALSLFLVLSGAQINRVLASPPMRVDAEPLVWCVAHIALLAFLRDGQTGQRSAPDALRTA